MRNNSMGKKHFVGVITQIEGDRYLTFLINGNETVRISDIVGMPLGEKRWVIAKVETIDTKYYMENPELYFISKAADCSLEKITEGTLKPRFGQVAKALILGHYQEGKDSNLVPIINTVNRYTPRPLDKVFMLEFDKMLSVYGLTSYCPDKNRSISNVFSLGNVCYPVENFEAFFYADTFLKHTLVSGTTGAGKSRFVSLMVKNLATNESDVTIIDPHNEYINLLYSTKKTYSITIVGRVIQQLIEYLKNIGIINWGQCPTIALGDKVVLDVETSEITNLEEEIPFIERKIEELKAKRKKNGENDNSEKQKEIWDFEHTYFLNNELLKKIARKDDSIYYMEDLGLKIGELQFTAKFLTGPILSQILPEVSPQQEEKLHEIVNELAKKNKPIIIDNLIREIYDKLKKIGYTKSRGKPNVHSVYEALQRKLKEAIDRKIVIDGMPTWMKLNTRNINILTGDYNTDDFGKRFISAIIQQFLRNNMKDKKQLLVIDEAHQLFAIENPRTRQLILQLLRESRKFNTAILMVTQNSTDIPEEIRGQFQNLIKFREFEDEEVKYLPDRMCLISLNDAHIPFIMRVANSPQYEPAGDISKRGDVQGL